MTTQETRTLLLLRHASADWNTAGRSDHDRELTPAGRLEAQEVGRFLMARGLVPDGILCSSAIRARQTAGEIMELLGIPAAPPVFQMTRRIYTADDDEAVDLLGEVDRAARRVLLVGHNPVLEELVQRLCGEPRSLPPAGLAHLEFSPEQWVAGSRPGTGELVQVFRPGDEIS